ncbi:MAG: ferritin-like domain-containing protein [Verrucomicrobiaceae bacterium]|jgi:ferritin-like metal-binding protein YciE|nr:ferritin-like domain-containing protein [Verrucomicrobiaceae bacterium]
MNTNEPTELQNLLTDQLRDIYWAEQKLAKTLPKLAKKAQSPALKTAFTSHLAETKTHIQRLEQVFALLGLKPRAKKCDAMQGLVEEGDGLAEEYAGSPALDAALICAAQKVEHYEIATYGTMRAFAKRLGLTEIVKLLSATLKEEGAADQKLTHIAESKANPEAQQ